MLPCPSPDWKLPESRSLPPALSWRQNPDSSLQVPGPAPSQPWPRLPTSHTPGGSWPRPRPLAAPRSHPSAAPSPGQRRGPAPPRPAMAPEESAEAARLLPSFERRFLAARTLRSFPWKVGGGARGGRARGGSGGVRAGRAPAPDPFPPPPRDVLGSLSGPGRASCSCPPGSAGGAGWRWAAGGTPARVWGAQPALRLLLPLPLALPALGCLCTESPNSRNAGFPPTSLCHSGVRSDNSR